MSISRGPEKPRWQKPELIVLVRSKPEEAVLAGCKTAIIIGPAKKGGLCTEGKNPCSSTTTS